MCKLVFVSIKDFLNEKYFQLQAAERRHITIEEFGAIFGAGKSLAKMWLSGQRTPANEYKKRIIEHYGDEAILAFDENPRLHKVQRVWDRLTPAQQDEYSAKAEQQAEENVKRASKKRKTTAT